MTKRVLVIGGYGNFGGYIARSLAADENLTLLVGGRSLSKAEQFCAQLAARHAPIPLALDIFANLADCLAQAQPDIVIHTTGPFQNQSYAVAEACLARGCHYIDLADARAFVAGIGRFDAAAKEKNLLLVSGASSVPCLTAAVIDHYRPRFRSLEIVRYGITAAQQTNRGLATTAAILSYVGKPFTTLIDGRERIVFGWQDLHRERYPELGWRWFGDCDIADLALFPARYPEIKTLRFGAGQELPLLHFGVWGLSWLVRLGFIPTLDRAAPLLLRLSFLADLFGSGRSGFHMFLSGSGSDGAPRIERFFIIARSGHGPYIPCMPAILLAKGLADGTVTATGSSPCLDLIDLKTYIEALRDLDISIIGEGFDG